MTDKDASPEWAVTAGKAIDLARDAGGFLRDTVGDVPRDLVGLIGGDWVHEQRRRNLAKMQARTEAMLKDIDRSRWTEPSVSVVLPLLQAAADEAREELQNLWARLLANAMVDGGDRVRRDYFEVVRQMEPHDASLFKRLAGRPPAMTHEQQQAFQQDTLQKLRISPNDYSISREKLVNLNCIRPHQYDPLTPFGIGLLGALAESKDG